MNSLALVGSLLRGEVKMNKEEAKAAYERGNIGLHGTTIDEIFGKEKKQKIRLGQGTTKNRFYYGTEIENTGNCYSCLITSDKNKNPSFLVGYNENNQIETELGVKYVAEFDEDALNYSWDNKAILEYLKAEVKPMKLKDLIEAQKQLWKQFVGFKDEREYYLHPCGVVNTYCFSLFDYQPRIDFRGQTESGKSTASKIYKLTGFNTIWVNKGSDAARFRDLESTSGTLLIDNFDNLPQEVKEDVCYFIEVSFDREGGTKRIMESVGKNKFRGKTLRAYCPMIVNSKLGYGVDSTQNRLITTVMEKVKNMPKLNTRLPIWKTIREQSRLWVLNNWTAIQKTYNKLELPEFDSRSEDIYKPILTIAKMADKKIFEQVKSLLQDKAKILKETAGEDSYEREVLSIALEMIGEKKTEKITVADLAEKLIESNWGYNQEQDRKLFMGKRKYAGTICKNILKSIPALNKPGRVSHPNNRETFEIYQKELVEFMQVRGYIKEGGNSYANINLY
jgi:hypothetical protein